MKRKAEKDADEGQTLLKGESPDEIKTVRLDGRCMLYGVPRIPPTALRDLEGMQSDRKE